MEDSIQICIECLRMLKKVPQYNFNKNQLKDRKHPKFIYCLEDLYPVNYHTEIAL